MLARSPSHKRDLSADFQRAEAFRARDMPDFEKQNFKPSLSQQDLTTPASPNLGTNARGAFHKARLERQLKEEEAEAAKQRAFRAQPIVQTSPLPEIRPCTPKKGADCKMGDKDHSDREYLYLIDFSEDVHLARFRKEAKEKVVVKDEVPVFRARACPATTYNRGRLPERPGRSLTVPDDVELRSTLRSKSREAYDMERAQRMAEAEEQKQLLEQERSVQEQHEVLSIRKSQEFKAKPLPSTTYEPGKLPEKQARPLTVPIEPQFAPHTPKSAPEEGDKENSVELNTSATEPAAWRSVRSALRKIRN